MNAILKLENIDESDMDSLMEFMQKIHSDSGVDGGMHFPKLVCLYDYIKNGNNETSKYLLGMKVERK